MQSVYWFVAEVNPRNAGYRIRTLPIVEELRAQGLEVEVRPFADMVGLIKEVADKAFAVVVSKPSDTTTHLCVRYIAERGVPVVVDLFDNYFSWSPSLFRRQVQWQWLRGLRSASLVISSSRYLRRVVESLTANPVVEVGDSVPLRSDEQGDLSGLLRKWACPERFEFLWFGISGNPYYLAGLEDLVRWMPMIRELSRCLSDSANMRVTICTNRVPAAEVVLAQFRSYEIDARFVEWTEEVCAELVQASHVVLLPTNLSGFSLSKTHNRCSEALANACLVLCSPTGPYLGIPGAVMDDPGVLASVLARSEVTEVRSLIEASLAYLRQRYDIAQDVARLKEALIATRRTVVKVSPVSPAVPKILITGRVNSDLVKFSRTIGYLVAGFADAKLNLNYDFRLEPLALSASLPTLSLSERAWAVVEAWLSHNVDYDLEDFEDHIECRVDGWLVRLQRSPRQLVIAEGIHPESLDRLYWAQTGGRGISSAHYIPWLEVHVDVITKIFWHLGLRDMDLAADEEGGWENFSANADPGLAASHGRLREQWIRYCGNEVEWGRPLGDSV